jgi:SAM-dependent methyltransferase
MRIDIRAEAAKFYDMQPDPFSKRDIEFYISQLPSSDCSVLEIGCGTGRVLLPLSEHCRSIQGIDVSDGMIGVCRQKLTSSQVNGEKISIEVCDARMFRVKKTFDLIIAPFRVFQNIENDEDVKAFFETVRLQLAENGRCILNVFKPWMDEPGVRREWEQMRENRKLWETDVQGGKVICYDKISCVHPTKFICYPTLVYEFSQDGRIVEKSELNAAMRCYSSEEFLKTIEENGFIIDEKWGGYSGEHYGEGPELVVKFRK